MVSPLDPAAREGRDASEKHEAIPAPESADEIRIEPAVLMYSCVTSGIEIKNVEHKERLPMQETPVVTRTDPTSE